MKTQQYVWVVDASMEYEGWYIVGIYEDVKEARARVARIERRNERHSKALDRWEAATENMGDGDDFPPYPLAPEHYGYSIGISKHRLIRKEEEP